MGYLVKRSTRDSSKFAIFTATAETVMQFAYKDAVSKISSITKSTKWIPYQGYVPKGTKKLGKREAAQLATYENHGQTVKKA